VPGFFSELKRRRVYQSAAIYAVAAWGLAQVVDFLAERLFLPDWIPTIAAIVFIVGFPVTIFLSWVFDIGSDGVRRTGTGSVRGVVSISAAILMLIGGTALIYSIVWPRHESTMLDAADANSIAVLPFTLLGDAAGAEFVSDGIAEEIIYALSSLRDLRVAARTSAFSFKGRNVGIDEIGQALNVRNVVEGSIRMTGDRLTVNVSLVRADTAYQVWSQRYVKFAEDIFAVQEDIAGSIADAIRSEMGISAESDRPRFRVQTENTEAYRLYLQGRFLWHQRGPDNINSAVAFFAQALELDPEFAAAWAGLASAYLTAGTYGAGIEDHFNRARAAAETAIELDPESGEPYGSLAQIYINNRQFQQAEAYIARGIELAPKNTSIRLWYATFLINVGRAVDAARHIEFVIDNDPAYPVMRANIGFSNFISGNLDLSELHFAKAWELGFRPYFMWHGQQMLNYARGDVDAAEKWIELRPPFRQARLEEATAEIDRLLLNAMRNPSREAKAALLGRADEMLEDKLMEYQTAALLSAWVGEDERAADLLLSQVESERSVDQGPLWLPFMKGVRAQPKFADVVIALQLTDYWQQVAWPDMCGPDPEQVVRCFN